MNKKCFRELKTFEEFIETVPESVRNDKIQMENTKLLFKMLKEIPSRKGIFGKFYLVTIYCKICGVMEQHTWLYLNGKS